MTGRHHLKLLIRVTLGILIFSAIGLSACSQAAPTTPATPTPPPVPAGGTTPPPVEQPAAPQPVTAKVNLAAFVFSPATVTVPIGSTVIWTNKDSAPHTVTSDSGVFDSGNLAEGGTFSHTFTQAGTFKYHCNLHPSMTGKIIVGQ
jgi:plastocyanin